MFPRRASASRASLARLLQDLPRDQLTALAHAWGIADFGAQSTTAAVYREMVNPESRERVVRGLPEAARLVFSELAAARRALAAAELLRFLPFSEEGIGESLAALERWGLVWRQLHPGREHAASPRWFVPFDIAALPPRARHATKAAAVSENPPRPGAPSLRESPPDPSSIRPSGAASRAISALVDGRRESLPPHPDVGPDVLAFAAHCATALGIAKRDGSRWTPGPRAAAWHDLDSVGRIRALARLWLIDERAPDRVPGRVRRALWQTLRGVEANRWYDLDTLARRVAWLAAAARPTSEDQPAELAAPRHSVARRDLDRAISTLAWIGVIAVAARARGRPAALRLTDTGQAALASADPLPGDE